MKIFTCFFISILTTLSLSLPAVAVTREPIRIEADHMMSLQKENSVFFSGKVEAKQGELLIHADEMTVYYLSQKKTASKPNSNEGGNDIDRIYAKGNVKITQKAWVATGDEVEYFAQERQVVITGNSKVWQDNNLVTGDKFVMYLDEGKSTVERSDKKGERVQAFFYPDSDQSVSDDK